jgi:signal transduction histidine kinase
MRVQSRTEPRPRQPQFPLRAFSRTEKVIAFSRLMLALAAAFIVTADPKQPTILPGATYASLASYIAFSWLVLWLVRTERVRQEVVARATVVADVAWITVLTLLTERGASPFFLLHVFVISSVAVRTGLRGTLRIAVVLAVTYPLTAYAASRYVAPDLFLFHRFHIVRPLYLLVLGYLIGYLGDHELRAKQKLSLMLELTSTARRGRPTGRTIGLLMRRLLRYFEAQHGLLSIRDPESGRYFNWLVTRIPGHVRVGLRITEASPCDFPFAESSEGFLANDVQPRRGSALCYVVATGSLERRALPATFRLPVPAAQALLVSPVFQQQQFVGHAVVASTSSRRCTRDDLEFLLLFVAQGATGLEAGRLQDKAEEIAVLEERARIARDLHDGFIQSLAAIDLRVETCKRHLERAPERVPAALDDLQQAVERGYRDVRHYLQILRNTTKQAEDLGTALDRVVAEMSLRHRMHVYVSRPDRDPQLALATVHEITHIVREALNNAVRHGKATQAIVKVAARPTHVFLVVRDNGSGFRNGTATDADGFLPDGSLPWSIRERSEVLGGDVRVWSEPGRGTELSMWLPRPRPLDATGTG